jgi:hypothetical protein
MSELLQAHVNPDGRYVVEIPGDDGLILYKTEPCPNRERALESARVWLQWFKNAPQGRAESIYYVLTVPETWPGPALGGHKYSGLHFKIGRSRDVRKRVNNLQTGTSGDLFLHAMEPGSSQRERELHEQFKSERRMGEWFSASPVLTKHVWETWRRHRILPPEFQAKMFVLMERIRVYQAIRHMLGRPPDMVNPSISEDWHGTVFVDLVYTRLLRGDDSTGD